MPDATAPPLLGVRSAAKQLGVHENTLRRWEEAGLIDACRLPSGVRRFRAEEIAQLKDEIYGRGDDRAVAAAAKRMRTTARA
ncbi:MAG: MerR family DNA-binding transcriptional regulator [Solirubrobacteraceae bacterium]